jgi:hypothetical protein
MLWCPLRFSRQNDVRFVFTPMCFVGGWCLYFFTYTGVQQGFHISLCACSLKVTQRLPTSEQERFARQKHLSSLQVFCMVRVAKSLGFYIVFVRWLCVPFLLVIVLCVLFFWSLYCVSFSFGHCIVCPFLLVTVLSVLFFWSLYCLSFSFGHCIVCPFLLVIVLSVPFFWSLYFLSFSFGHCIVCSFSIYGFLLTLWYFPTF